MSEQYFSRNPNSPSNPNVITAVLRQHTFPLLTDSGVFSRRGIDLGTTLLANAVEVKAGDCVLDLGCGYGPVGIAIGLDAPGVSLYMVDINERAVALAIRNVRQNELADRATVLQSDGVSALPEGLSFAVIVFNPPIRAGKAQVWALYRQAYGRLDVDGAMYVVIQKKQGADSSEKYLSTLFSDVSAVAKNKGYKVFRCRRHEGETK